MNSGLQLSKTEIQMMNEVFAVMSRYSNSTRQFAMHLSHTHFPMNKGEVLYETHDAKKRMLTIVPKKIKGKTNVPLATAWNKINGKLAVEMFCCDDGGSEVIVPVNK